MIIEAWLVLIVGPATFKLIDTLPSQQQCLEAKHSIVVEKHFSPEQAEKIQCITIAKGKIGDA